MELKDRIAAVRKAAGLTQEQLGELVGVSRQAVSKWEAGQTVPDAATVATLCRALHVSADYVLLGKEPEETQTTESAPAYALPDTCPCCGRAVEGTICPVCGYTLPAMPPRGPKYAVIALSCGFSDQKEHSLELSKYCGCSVEYGRMLLEQYSAGQPRFLLRRGLTDSAAHYMAAHLDRNYFNLCVVADDGEENDDALLTKPQAMELPPSAKPDSGIGFWGVVGAVVVALLILSFL